MIENSTYKEFLISTNIGTYICFYCDLKECINKPMNDKMKLISYEFIKVKCLRLSWKECQIIQNLDDLKLYDVFVIHKGKEINRIYNPNENELRKIFKETETQMEKDPIVYSWSKKLMKERCSLEKQINYGKPKPKKIKTNTNVEICKNIDNKSIEMYESNTDLPIDLSLGNKTPINTPIKRKRSYPFCNNITANNLKHPINQIHLEKYKNMNIIQYNNYDKKFGIETKSSNSFKTSAFWKLKNVTNLKNICRRKNQHL